MTVFSPKQRALLRRNPPQDAIRSRQRAQREISYLEGWFVISEANRIFGFDRWSRETIEARCLSAREIRGELTAIYMAKVRISVHGNGPNIIREAHGTSEAKGGSLGEVHEMALKAAETDATKRALATFGSPFGLALYCPRKENKSDPLSIPNQDQSMSVPANMSYVGSILLPKARRVRNREHLKFVASKPCLVCGRSPSDAHHIKFSQRSAIGMKVSDEFTVPLCRGHHRELHHSGNEKKWWVVHKIDPLVIAQNLFRRSQCGN